LNMVDRVERRFHKSVSILADNDRSF
jgi:hypothetical protein